MAFGQLISITLTSNVSFQLNKITQKKHITTLEI